MSQNEEKPNSINYVHSYSLFIFVRWLAYLIGQSIQCKSFSGAQFSSIGSFHSRKWYKYTVIKFTLHYQIDAFSSRKVMIRGIKNVHFWTIIVWLDTRAKNVQNVKQTMHKINFLGLWSEIVYLLLSSQLWVVKNTSTNCGSWKHLILSPLQVTSI